MTTKEKIEFYTCHLEDRARNMWKVIEVSDLEDIMETYHQEQVKKLNIDDVSNNVVALFCGCTVPSLNYGITADYKCNKCNRPIK